MCLGVQTSGGSDRSGLPERPRLLLIHVHHLWAQQGINEQSLTEKAGRKEEAAAINPWGSLAPSSKACVPEQNYNSTVTSKSLKPVASRIMSSTFLPLRLCLYSSWPPSLPSKGSPLLKAEGRAQGTRCVFRDLATHFQSPFTQPLPCPWQLQFSVSTYVSMCLHFIYTTHVCC